MTLHNICETAWKEWGIPLTWGEMGKKTASDESMAVKCESYGMGGRRPQNHPAGSRR